MNKTIKYIAIGIGIAILCTVALGLLIYLLQYLWNWLIPSIIGWRAITYWEALGLFILSKILFKGFAWSGGHKSRWNSHWKTKWTQKWETMSPEDRERFKQKMREKCGWTGSKSEPTQPNNQ
jgi:hypothetical protein